MAVSSQQLKLTPQTATVFPVPQVFLVRKVTGSDAGQLYAMKVLKKATLKGKGPGRGQLLLSYTTAVFLGV